MARAGIQSCAPDKVDASLVNIKGHDYYKDTFVPPAEDVTEIDPRDKVGAASLALEASVGCSLGKYLRSRATHTPLN